MKISIIIPCYNEKNTIGEILKKVKNVNVLNCEKEIIVVDDNSNDGSSEILDKLKKNFEITKLINNSKNQGKGFSIREGIKNSNGDIIMLSGKLLRQALDKFMQGEVAQNARVQVCLPNGDFYDITGIQLMENKLIGVRESHRLVITIDKEKWRMGQVIKKL